MLSRLPGTMRPRLTEARDQSTTRLPATTSQILLATVPQNRPASSPNPSQASAGSPPAPTSVLGGLAAVVLLSMGLGVAITTQLYSLQQEGYPVPLIGVVSSAMGAGMLLSSTFAGRLMARFRGGILVLVCGLLMLVCLAILAWVDPPWQIMLLIGVFALGIPVFTPS